MQISKYTPHLALLCTNLIWAIAYPMYHLVLNRYIEPISILTATLIISAIFSFIPLLWQKAERVHKDDIIALIGAAILIAVIRKGLLIFALSKTSPIDGSIISTFTPIVILVISIIIGIEKFSNSKLLGLLLGLGGAIGVILTSGSDATHPTQEMLGNTCVLGCAIISAIYMIWFKSLLKKYSPTTILRYVFCISTIIITPFGIKPLLHTDFVAMPTHILIAVLYLMIMPTYIPNLLQNYALKYVQPTVSGTFAYIQPIVAGAVSIYIGVDKPEWQTLIFATLIFLGVGVVIRSYAKK